MEGVLALPNPDGVALITLKTFKINDRNRIEH